MGTTREASRGPWGLGHRVGLALMRQASGLHPAERVALAARRQDALERLADLDRRADAVAGERAAVVAELTRLRDQLWPPLGSVHDRRPPVHDQPPLAPLVATPRWLWGRELRTTALALLARLGPLGLAELHHHLHLGGFGVAGRRPTQVLADALASEAEAGRARRRGRGVYGVGPAWRPRPGPLALAPDVGGGPEVEPTDGGVAPGPGMEQHEVQ